MSVRAKEFFEFVKERVEDIDIKTPNPPSN
jgi:hypothetical protein